MWITLTRTDQTTVAVNMDRVTDFREIGGKTVLTTDVREDGGLKVIRVAEGLSDIMKRIGTTRRVASRHESLSEFVHS